MAADPKLVRKRSYIFNLDILIEDETNGRALEKLLHLLNDNDITDYRIQSGIELGGQLQQAIQEASHSTPLQDLPAGKRTAKPSAPAASAPAPSSSNGEDHRAIWTQFQQFRQSNTLVRLTIVKAMGVKLSVPCRILNTDPENGNVSVYHVDEKQVYLFNINEIDDFSIS